MYDRIADPTKGYITEEEWKAVLADHLQQAEVTDKDTDMLKDHVIQWPVFQ